MFEKKYHLYLEQDEYDCVIRCLIDLKNRLLQQGRYTDDVDDVLIKVLNAKKKKIKIVDGSQWFKNNNQWADRSYEPSAGDIIFFDWENDGTTDHVGIVWKCENGTVYTIEGNSNNQCLQRTYTVGSSVIYRYGLPAY